MDRKSQLLCRNLLADPSVECYLTDVICRQRAVHNHFFEATHIQTICLRMMTQWISRSAYTTVSIPLYPGTYGRISQMPRENMAFSCTSPVRRIPKKHLPSSLSPYCSMYFTTWKLGALRQSCRWSLLLASPLPASSEPPTPWEAMLGRRGEVPRERRTRRKIDLWRREGNENKGR